MHMYFALPRVSLITTMCRMMLICTKEYDIVAMHDQSYASK